MAEHQHRRVGAVVAAGLALTAFLFYIKFSQRGAEAQGAGQQDTQLNAQSFQGRALAGGQLWQLTSGLRTPDDTAGPELTWEEARAWLRDQIEAIAAADNRTGWHGTADPPGPLAAILARRNLLARRERRGLSAAEGETDSAAADTAAAEQAAQQDDLISEGEAAAGGDGPDDAGGVAAPTQQTALLAVPTANIWNKTQLMIASLAAVKDRFELLVVDELSTDETVPELRRMGVNVIQPPDIVGVTYNWNLAYRHWKKSSHEYFFISNNDVLVPDGALTSLMHVMRDGGRGCDLVSPMSTVRGKGWRPREGIEKVLKLSPLASAWANRPQNFDRIQAVLDAVPAAADTLVKDTVNIHNMSFSGFFFGMRRNIDVAAYDPEHGYLFDPKLRILGQEQDLWDRMMLNKMRTCLDVGSFVYHFKGSTISPDMTSDRESFRAPG